MTIYRQKHRKRVKFLAAGSLVLLCFGCANDEVPRDFEKVSALRIERAAVWLNGREAFALRENGSGFYERYSPFDENGNVRHKVISRVDFDEGKGNFQKTFGYIKGLQEYVGDDRFRAELARHYDAEKLKKAFPCGPQATDNNNYIIYWNTVSPLVSGNKERDLFNTFVMNGGCQSKEATVIWERIENAVDMFDDLVPVSKR